MASSYAYTRMMNSNSAQGVQDQIAAFATHWIINWRNHASVPEELALVRKLADDALVRAAETWNYQHHALVKFPIEIFEHCWSFLDIAGLVRVSATCRLWRKRVLDTPALWQGLNFRAHHVDHLQLLAPLLERSKDRLVDVSVDFATDFRVGGALESVLQPHEHRLRRLELHSQYNVLGQHELRLDAPSLRVFLSGLTRYHIDPDYFPIKCPALVSMDVYQLRLGYSKPWAPFTSLTTLSIGWNGGKLSQLYATFPNLESLHIECVLSRPYAFGRAPVFDLPRDKPPPTSLQRVMLREVEVSYEDLVAFGFTTVGDLLVEGCPDKFDDFLTLFDALGGTPLSVVMEGHVLTVKSLVDGSRKLCMVLETANLDQYHAVVARPAVHKNITSFSWLLLDPVPPENRLKFILPEDEFPALEELILPVGHPILDLDVMPTCGKLRAPALRRLAIVDTPRTCCDGDARVLNPLYLAIFVARHIELAPGRKLDELVLDADQGVRLSERLHQYDDGLEILLTYVNTVSHKWHKPKDD